MATTTPPGNDDGLDLIRQWIAELAGHDGGSFDPARVPSQAGADILNLLTRVVAARSASAELQLQQQALALLAGGPAQGSIPDAVLAMAARHTVERMSRHLAEGDIAASDASAALYSRAVGNSPEQRARARASLQAACTAWVATLSDDDLKAQLSARVDMVIGDPASQPQRDRLDGLTWQAEILDLMRGVLNPERFTQELADAAAQDVVRRAIDDVADHNIMGACAWMELFGRGATAVAAGVRTTEAQHHVTHGISTAGALFRAVADRWDELFPEGQRASPDLWAAVRRVVNSLRSTVDELSRPGRALDVG